MFWTRVKAENQYDKYILRLVFCLRSEIASINNGKNKLNHHSVADEEEKKGGFKKILEAVFFVSVYSMQCKILNIVQGIFKKEVV